MMGDHLVLGIFFILAPLVVPLPIMFLGIFVSVVQTLVFVLLSMAYFSGAIEQEDEGIDPDDGEASLEGFISDFTDNSSFMVSGQQVNATDATFEPAGLTLSNDLRVEVEGTIVNGILIAEKVELEE